jgi:hypothetical protein
MMAALGGGPVGAALFLNKLRGGSQPVLVGGTNGSLYVLKFKNNLQGPNVLFNEAAGAELFRACGLAVPPWERVVVTEEFLDRNRECWLETSGGEIRPESGWCFGSRFQFSARRRLLTLLPGTYHSRIRNRKSFWTAWFVDVCCDHADRRDAVFLEGRNGLLDALFVDCGHMFGGPDGDRRPRPLASRYFDSRIYPGIASAEAESILRDVRALDADELWKRVRAIPADWQAASALECFARGLDRLRDGTWGQSIMEGLLEIQAGQIQGRTEQDSDRWIDQRRDSVPSNTVRVDCLEPSLHPAK